MAETINMPKLGFDMAEGLLVRWVKQIGEEIKKGDVLAAARLAAIMATKRTAELIPLCHPLRLTSVDVAFDETDGDPALAERVVEILEKAK